MAIRPSPGGVCLESFPKYGNHPLMLSFSGLCRGQRKMLLAREHFMEGNFQGERAHMYLMYFLGLHICHSRQQMHKIFIPPFPLSIGGIIQWDRAFLNLFPTTLAQHTDTWIAWIGLCFLDGFSALSHAGMMGSYTRTDQMLSVMAVDTLSCFQPFTV